MRNVFLYDAQRKTTLLTVSTEEVPPARARMGWVPLTQPLLLGVPSHVEEGAKEEALRNISHFFQWDAEQEAWSTLAYREGFVSRHTFMGYGCDTVKSNLDLCVPPGALSSRNKYEDPGFYVAEYNDLRTASLLYQAGVAPSHSSFVEGLAQTPGEMARLGRGLLWRRVWGAPEVSGYGTLALHSFAGLPRHCHRFLPEPKLCLAPSWIIHLSCFQVATSECRHRSHAGCLTFPT